jgi:hypothetical protein
MDQALIDALTQRHIGLEDPNVAPAFAQSEPIQVADLRDDRNTRRCCMDFASLAEGDLPQRLISGLWKIDAQAVIAIENARLHRFCDDGGEHSFELWRGISLVYRSSSGDRQ